MSATDLVHDEEDNDDDDEDGDDEKEEEDDEDDDEDNDDDVFVILMWNSIAAHCQYFWRGWVLASSHPIWWLPLSDLNEWN